MLQTVLLKITNAHSLNSWAVRNEYWPQLLPAGEHALAHQLPDAVERAYQRGSQFAKRTGLITDWSVYCSTTQTDAILKPIRSAAESSKMNWKIKYRLV